MSDQDNKEGKQPDSASREGDSTAAAGGAAPGQVGRQLTDLSEDIHRQIIEERDEYLDSLQRLQADFDNYRKRVTRESETSSGRVAAEIVEELLPVLDNFERAMQAAMNHDKQVLSEGVELVFRQLREVLDRRGLCEIEAMGEDFDPAHHEAVLCQSSDVHDEGKVVDVLEKGYRVNDKVVRPARVIVSEGPAPADKEKA